MSSQEALAALLIKDGWIDAQQSNGAYAMAAQVYRVRSNLLIEDHGRIVALLDIVLRFNHDPNDTDLAGTVVTLLDFMKADAALGSPS